MKRHHFSNCVRAIAIWLAVGGIGWSQDAALSTDAASPAAGEDLAVEQARLSDRFKRLEEILSQLAELSAATDPNRARLLREAISRSREQDINVRFESIVKLLEDERLSAATSNQTQLQGELDGLLELLLKAERDKELDSQRDRVREYLKEVGRLIRMQKGVRARTEGGDGIRGLADDQQRVADATGKLGGTIEEKEAKNKEDEGGKKDGDSKTEDKKEGEQKDGETKDGKPKDGDGKSSEPGKSSEQSKGEPSEGQPSDGKPSGKPSEGQPSDGKPNEGQPSPGQPGSPSPGNEGSSEQQQGPPPEPTDRATERLRKAQQQMEGARKKLDEAEREGAVERQKEALAELERAKAELERVLRQLREEEMERLLTQLAARFRKMLEIQNAVYEGTQRLEKVGPANRNHDHEIESGRLSRQESLIAREAEKALVLLHEEGSSVAFPEAIDLMHHDMLQVAERLGKVKTDGITQGLERDIIEVLEETIAALEKAAKQLEKKRAPQGQQPAAGQQQEPPLVDKLAELKLIRSLQVRINRRTQRYSEMVGGDQAETPDLLKALKDLSERQQRVYQATYDLSRGLND